MREEGGGGLATPRPINHKVPSPSKQYKNEACNYMIVHCACQVVAVVKRQLMLPHATRGDFRFKASYFLFCSDSIPCCFVLFLEFHIFLLSRFFVFFIAFDSYLF